MVTVDGGEEVSRLSGCHDFGLYPYSPVGVPDHCAVWARVCVVVLAARDLFLASPYRSTLQSQQLPSFWAVIETATNGGVKDDTSRRRRGDEGQPVSLS